MPQVDATEPSVIFRLPFGGVELDYPCPPGEGIDVIGTAVLVRVFGPGARHRWPANRGPAIEDFDPIYRAAFEDVLQVLVPGHLDEFRRSRSLPESWTGTPAEVDRLWEQLRIWHATIYPEAVFHPEMSARHRAVHLFLGVLQRQGRLPQAIDWESYVRRVRAFGEAVSPARASQLPTGEDLTPGDIYLSVAQNPDAPAVWHLPPDSGSIELWPGTLLDRLRRRRRADQTQSEGSDPNEDEEEVQPRETPRASVAVQLSDLQERELRDYLDAVRAEGPLRAAAVDYCLEDRSVSEVAEVYGVTERPLRDAVSRLRDEIRRRFGT